MMHSMVDVDQQLKYLIKWLCVKHMMHEVVEGTYVQKLNPTVMFAAQTLLQ